MQIQFKHYNPMKLPAKSKVQFEGNNNYVV